VYIVVCTDDTRTIFLKQNSNEVSVRSVFLLGILAAEPCKRVISVEGYVWFLSILIACSWETLYFRVGGGVHLFCPSLKDTSDARK